MEICAHKAQTLCLEAVVPGARQHTESVLLGRPAQDTSRLELMDAETHLKYKRARFWHCDSGVIWRLLDEIDIFFC